MRCRVACSLLTVAFSSLGLASLTSCGPDAPAGGGLADSQLTNPPSGRPREAPSRQAGMLTGGSRSAVGTSDNLDSPVPPRDAQWTLLVYSERGPSHVTDASALKNALIQRTGRHDWYVIHSRDDSNIYFGYYHSFDDPKDPATKGAQSDLKFVKDLEMLAEGGQPVKAFDHCGFVPIAAPDPVAPPEWNLFDKDRNKAPRDPTRAYWSLQIMAFRAHPLRKEAAVAAVETLRKKGVEAYFYHGDTISSVCVGAWPISAIEQQTHDGDHTPANPEDILQVLPEGPLPPGTKLKDHDDQGHKIVTVSPVLNILDQGLKEMTKQYPFHWVNYEINRHKTTDGGFQDDPSFMVVIPRAPGNGYYDSNDVTPADLAAADQEPWHTRPQASADPFTPSIPAGPVMSRPPESIGTYSPPTAATPGVGHLRRLGDN